MNTPRFDIFEAYAHEHNSRILKASDDARLLRSLARKNKVDARQSSPKSSQSSLMSILASLIYIIKQLPA